MPQHLPGGNTFFGWLGRQVGYVKKAVKADPAAVVARTKPPPAPPPPKPAPASAAPHTEAHNEPTVIYRDGKVEEAPHPTEPGMKLRRTIIDEVIVERPDGAERQ